MVKRFSLGLLFAALLLILWLSSVQLTNDLPVADLLYFNYTLPRILMALLAGASLGLASCLLQQVIGNPLASDNTLAVSSGAQFALF